MPPNLLNWFGSRLGSGLSRRLRTSFEAIYHRQKFRHVQPGAVDHLASARKLSQAHRRLDFLAMQLMRHAKIPAAVSASAAVSGCSTRSTFKRPSRRFCIC